MKRVDGLDVLMLYSETPNTHNHTLKIAVIDVGRYDGHFSFELFRRTMSRRLHLLEPLCYKLVDIPLKLHHPMWLHNCEIDLDYHLRRVRIPDPGGRRELDQLIGEIASVPLDRRRPLWEFHVVEGMADDRFAVIGKVHHALADGVASANLIARALDSYVRNEREVCATIPHPPPTKGQLLRCAARDHLQQIRKMPQLIRRTGAGISRVRERSKKRSTHPELARSFRASPTFINHGLSPRRRFATATLALSDVKQTSKRLGITINDLVLATAAGALRTLLLRYDGRADAPMVAMVPATIDASTDRVSGNEFSGLSVSLPVQVKDPMERVQLTRLATERAKEDFRLLGPSLLSEWASFLPPMLAPAAFQWVSGRNSLNKAMNLPISNVPGPRERGRFGGATISEIYSVGPLFAGSGMNITVWSYVDQLNISVLTDEITLADPHEGTEAMVESFIELRHAAGLLGQLTEVDGTMSPASAMH